LLLLPDSLLEHILSLTSQEWDCLRPDFVQLLCLGHINRRIRRVVYSGSIWTMYDVQALWQFKHSPQGLNDVLWSILCRLDLAKVDFSGTFEFPIAPERLNRPDNLYGRGLDSKTDEVLLTPFRPSLCMVFERAGPYIRDLYLYDYEGRFMGREWDCDDNYVERMHAILRHCQFLSGLTLSVSEFPFRHERLLVTITLKSLSLECVAIRQISDMMGFILAQPRDTLLDFFEDVLMTMRMIPPQTPKSKHMSSQ